VDVGNVGDMQHSIACVFQYSRIKAVGAMLAALLFGERCMPIYGAIVVLFVADWLLGFTIAAILRKISSTASMRGIIKGLVYAIIILTAAQLQKIELVGPWISSALLALVALTEAVSVLEKVDKLSMMYQLNLPFLRVVIKYLRQHSADIVDDIEAKSKRTKTMKAGASSRPKVFILFITFIMPKPGVVSPMRTQFRL